MPSYSAYKKTGGIFYNPEDVKLYEVLILKELNYKLDYITSYDIIKSLISYGVFVRKKFLNDTNSQVLEYVKQYFVYVCFLLDELITETKIVHYTQLQLSCACLIMAANFKYPEIDIQHLLFKKLKFQFSDINNAQAEIKSYKIFFISPYIIYNSLINSSIIKKFIV